MNPQSTASGRVLLALGANSQGPWGEPVETLRRALSELTRRGLTVERISPFYATAAVGPARQPAYVNAVALLATTLPAEALLRLLKQMEAQAGRRGGRPWGPRTLDLDIIDYKGLRVNWKAGSKRRPFRRSQALVLPHPGLADRPFVLLPLLDVAPDWRHPALKLGARELLGRLPRQGPGGVLKRLEQDDACLPAKDEPPK